MTLTSRDTRLQQFFRDNADKPKGATLYHPPAANDLTPEVLEGDAQALRKDPRVLSVEEKSTPNGKLYQLWVVMESE